MIPLIDVLTSLKTLGLEDLDKLAIAVDNLKASAYINQVEVRDYVEPQYPKISIPLEYTPPHLENVFIMFLENVTKHYKNDYSFSDPDTLTNDLSVQIQSYYNDEDFKTGQFPKIAVKCDSVRISNASLADRAPKGGGMMGPATEGYHMHCWMDFNIYFDVISPQDTECDILATKYAMHLTQNRAMLRQLGNLYQVDYPSISYAQKTREYGNLFLSRVNFSVRKEMQWLEVINLEAYNNYVVDLVAVCKRRPECKGFEQFLYVGFDPDNKVEVGPYLDMLHNSSEKGDNC